MNDKIILASASPRRRELMPLITPDFDVIPADIDETIPENTLPSLVPMRLAVEKAVYVASRNRNRTVIGCDTIVLCGGEYGEPDEKYFTLAEYDLLKKRGRKLINGGEIMGKPEDAADAKRMLKTLSGRTHFVITGYCFARFKETGNNSVIFQNINVTEVEFYPLTEEEIDGYIAAGEPFDKAGAYGIQGFGGLFVKSIKGDYNNVVGLPAAEIKRELAEFRG